MTTTPVVEDALRNDIASGGFGETASALRREGQVLVIPANGKSLGLSDAVGRFTAAGGAGSRLYDRLIGEVAVTHGLRTIVTWNTSHRSGLFPGLRVIDPAVAPTLLSA